MGSKEVSSAGRAREHGFMNVGLDREHYSRLLVLTCLWKEGTPSRMVEMVVDGLWRQFGRTIPEDLTLEEFEGLAALLQDVEA